MRAVLMSRQRLQLAEALFHDPDVAWAAMERRESFGALWNVPRERISAPLEEGKALAPESDGRHADADHAQFLLGAGRSRTIFRTLIVEKQLSSDLVVAHLGRCFFKGIAPGGACPAIPAESTSEGGTRA